MLVEPPMAYAVTIAFSKARIVMMSRGRRPVAMSAYSASTLARAWTLTSSCTSLAAS